MTEHNKFVRFGEKIVLGGIESSDHVGLLGVVLERRMTEDEAYQFIEEHGQNLDMGVLTIYSGQLNMILVVGNSGRLGHPRDRSDVERIRQTTEEIVRRIYLDSEVLVNLP